jgi:thiamine-phosphate pyrophosphorylase
VAVWPKRSKRALPSALNAICDADAAERAGWTLLDFAAACLDGGARFLQIRAKGRPSGWLLEACAAIVRRAEPTGALIIVNDRADLARISGAGGVHVGQDDLSSASVRAIVGPDAVVGLSTHTAEQLTSAIREPVDYVAVGPIFTTASKATGYDPVGIERVRQASAVVAGKHPIVAIGGITLDTAPALIAEGAQAVAVISDLLATGDPAARVAEYLARLERV